MPLLLNTKPPTPTAAHVFKKSRLELFIQLSCLVLIIGAKKRILPGETILIRFGGCHPLR
jgi:hypothetical protein